LHFFPTRRSPDLTRCARCVSAPPHTHTHTHTHTETHTNKLFSLPSLIIFILCVCVCVCVCVFVCVCVCMSLCVCFMLVLNCSIQMPVSRLFTLFPSSLINTLYHYLSLSLSLFLSLPSLVS